jgi:group I intron endonuclease
MRNTKIYGLLDPRTNEVRYVGKTIQTLEARLRKHISDKPKSNTYRFNWINQLKELNLKPTILILELCDEKDWVEREKYWISYFENLTNLTTGGEGCDYFSEEIRDKISLNVKKAWENDDFRKRISEQRKIYWSNMENRKAHGNKLRGKPITDKHKDSISLGRKDGKPIIVGGVEYRNIKYAVKHIPINRGTLKRRLKSDNFPEYHYL